MPQWYSWGTSVHGVRVATWNVNSVRSRLPRLLPWLDARAPDVVCLQETKLPADAFDALVRPALTERGYAIAHHGDGRWNGVAIASRVGLDDVVAGLVDEPANPVGQGLEPEARAVSATCAGLRISSVYVPNGRAPDDPHYRYKLDWLAALRTTVAAGGSRGDGDLWGHERRARRRRRVRPGGVCHLHPRHTPGTRRVARSGATRRGSGTLARCADLHVLGLPSRHVPPGPGDADRPGARRYRRRAADLRCVGGPPGP